MRAARQRAREPRRRAARNIVACVAALGSLCAGAAPPSSAEPNARPGQSVASPSPAPSAVAVTAGRVTVDVRDADLAEVLTQLAERAAFRLTTAGSLGRVTASFTDQPVERALRRLAQPHELMFVYSAPARAGAESTLLQVRVFAAQASLASQRALDSATLAQRGPALGQIARLSRARHDPASAAQLTELLAHSRDPLVRAKAAWGLGRVGGPAAAAGLATALGDQAVDVRVQAVYALRVAENSRAIPALAHVLTRDPDAVVRQAAARTLAGMPDPAATSVLAAAVNDADPIVRTTAGRTLQARGVSAPR